MKFLLIRERGRRTKFKKSETQYLALKSIVRNQKLSSATRWEATLLLSKLIKKQSPVSFKNRCFLTGRGGSYVRFLNLSRLQALALARNNELPFIKKASW